jgi:hypothetical protein
MPENDVPVCGCVICRLGFRASNKKASEVALLALLFLMVRPERFELPTAWFVARYSIQLSYGRIRGGILHELN